MLTPDGSRWRYRYAPSAVAWPSNGSFPDGARIVEQAEFVWDGTVVAEQAHTDGVPNGGRRGDQLGKCAERQRYPVAPRG